MNEGATAARPLVFIDFEASGLTPGSWPIEIGIAWISGSRVASRASVIAPRADWSLSDWSEASSRIHGLSLAEVRGGSPADAVAAETDALAGVELVSDNPGWDQLWLDRLRAGRAPIRLTPLRAAVSARLSHRASDAFACALLRSEAPHRAGPDAERLARAWLEATEAVRLAA